MFLENHINAIKSKNKHKDNTSNISTVKHFLENHINAIKSKNKHKDEVSFTNRCVQDIVTVVDECKFVNPFDFDITNRCICFRRISYDYESPYEYGDALAQHLIIIWSIPKEQPGNIRKLKISSLKWEPFTRRDRNFRFSCKDWFIYKTWSGVS